MILIIATVVPRSDLNCHHPTDGSPVHGLGGRSIGQDEPCLHGGAAHLDLTIDPIRCAELKTSGHLTIGTGAAVLLIIGPIAMGVCPGIRGRCSGTLTARSQWR